MQTETHRPVNGLYVDGLWRDGSAGAFPVHNPATQEVVGWAPEASPQDVADAVDAARRAFPEWSRTDRDRRAQLLRRIARGLRSARGTLTPLIVAESGCTVETAGGMIDRAAQRFAEFADTLLGYDAVPLLPELRTDASVLVGEVARRPHGVVACITPFNFPLIGAASKIAPAIAMGNTVVYKPAPQDPLAVLAFGQICHAAGMPTGVLNIVTGSGPETGQALVASPGVDMVSFTGSTLAGTEIYRAGAATMRRNLLELGGKGALIVRADADLDAAVTALARVWTYYAGQWCAAPTRAIVHRSVHDEVVARLQEVARSLRVGDPRDENTEVGPVISAAQRDRIEGMVAEAVRDGAREVVRELSPVAPTEGFYAPPALLVGCRRDMAVVQNEVFGPVLSVLSYDDDDEAVELANDSPFGLTNYVYSADVPSAWRIAAQLRSGSVLVNTSTPHANLPFGGMGLSGLGRDGGRYALEAYSEAQGVAVAL